MSSVDPGATASKWKGFSATTVRRGQIRWIFRGPI
jgi:hypothetical protein